MNERGPYWHILEAHDYQPVVRDPWLHCGESQRVAGWKLHLSTVPLEAESLLRRTLPTLRQHHCSFKLARDPAVLEALLEGALGPTQIGKFITIYPNDDDHAAALARALIGATWGLRGPTVPSDLHLGSVVYARYGGFHPRLERNRLGDWRPLIELPDQTAVEDRYDRVAPEGVEHPFAGLIGSPEPRDPNDPNDPNDRLLGPGYFLLQTLRSQGKGSTFTALDVRDKAQIAAVVLKQGRALCLADGLGRDMRTRLRRQAQLHASLSDGLKIPRAQPYFEHHEHGYLPLEFIDGATLEQRVRLTLGEGRWTDLAHEARESLLEIFAKVLTQVAALHATGHAHRDLTVSNLLIDRRDDPWLLDLELTHHVDDRSPAYGLGTPGFMSPQQQRRHAPAFADDIYALGMVGGFLLNGVDPARFAGLDHQARRELLTELGGPTRLIEVLAACANVAPEQRPTLAALRHAVAEADRRERPRPAPPFDPAALVRAGIHGLRHRCPRDQGARLWLSPTVEVTMQRDRGLTELSSYRHYADAFRGVAGVVYVLARAARVGAGPAMGDDPSACASEVQGAVRWLLDHKEPRGLEPLPGLCFGEAGRAVAIAEAVAAGLVERDDALDRYLERALAGPLDWPDFTHGAAGQGVAALHCSDLLGEPALAAHASACAAYLVDTQEQDGAWITPPGVEGMSGETLTGLSHGVAGIAYFLVEQAARSGDPQTKQAADRALAWLARAARRADGRVLGWSYGDAHEPIFTWWNHGAPGIAHAFLRAFERFGQAEHADLAVAALDSLPRRVKLANLGMGQGIAGVADVLLEAHRVLGQDRWRARAVEIAQIIERFATRTDDGSSTWLVEDRLRPTADLMVGCGGIVHLFLRLCPQLPDPGSPLLLGPAAS